MLTSIVGRFFLCLCPRIVYPATMAVLYPLLLAEVRLSRLGDGLLAIVGGEFADLLLQEGVGRVGGGEFLL